jgi:hypothetical protein
VIEHSVDGQTVRERSDVQLGEEGSLGGADLITGLDQVHVTGNLDLTIHDLGRDLEDLEEVGLSRVAAGRTGRDDDVHN